MPEGARRGECHGFSRSSRLNMLATVHAIDRASIVCTFFVTLTVPAGEGGWQEMESWRSLWFKRFERRWGRGRCFIVWKKELHKNGTPHLHALIFWVENPPHLKDFRPWNDDAWADTVKSQNPHHRRVGCRVELMNSWNGVGHYCAKYLAKDQDGLQAETGRIWGVWNRELRNTRALNVQSHQMQPMAGRKVRRVLRRLQRRRRESWWVLWEKKWCKLRRVKNLSVLDQVAQAKAAGLRVKRCRPRCQVTRQYQVWAETITSSRALGREIRQLEPVGVEISSYAPSLHFVQADTALRLMRWATAEMLDQLEEEKGLPI